MNNPMEICGWAALLEALRYANEIDPGCNKRVKEKPLEHYIIRRRDTLVHVNFPCYQPNPVKAPQDPDRPRYSPKGRKTRHSAPQEATEASQKAA
jgi:hypothetical protein